MGEALHARYAITKPRSHWPTWDQLEDPAERRDADAPRPEGSERGQTGHAALSFPSSSESVLRKPPTWPLAGSDALAVSIFSVRSRPIDRTGLSNGRWTGRFFKNVKNVDLGPRVPPFVCRVRAARWAEIEIPDVETEKCPCLCTP